MESPDLKEGTSVELFGLVKKPELNKKQCRVCGPKTSEGRYPVFIDATQKTILLKQENLVVLSGHSEPSNMGAGVADPLMPFSGEHYTWDGHGTGAEPLGSSKEGSKASHPSGSTKEPAQRKGPAAPPKKRKDEKQFEALIQAAGEGIGLLTGRPTKRGAGDEIVRSEAIASIDKLLKFAVDAGYPEVQFSSSDQDEDAVFKHIKSAVTLIEKAERQGSYEARSFLKTFPRNFKELSSKADHARRPPGIKDEEHAEAMEAIEAAKDFAYKYHQRSPKTRESVETFHRECSSNVNRLQSAVDAGYPDAQYFSGYLQWQLGQSVKAVSLLKRAAEQGHDDASRLMAGMLEKGAPGEESRPSGITDEEHAEAMEAIEAAEDFADRLQQRSPKTRESVETFRCECLSVVNSLQSAVDAGYQDAQYFSGYLQWQLGGSSDRRRSISLLRKAAEQGHGEASNLLPQMLKLQRQSSKKETEDTNEASGEADSASRRAGAKKEVFTSRPPGINDEEHDKHMKTILAAHDALDKLTSRRRETRVSEKMKRRGYTSIVELVQSAVHAGYRDAQYLSGLMQRQLGFTDKAISLLRKAADQGHDNASPLLVEMLTDKGDHKGAFEWCKRSADRKTSDVDAYINLATMYMEGKGTARNHVEAEEVWESLMPSCSSSRSRLPSAKVQQILLLRAKNQRCLGDHDYSAEGGQDVAKATVWWTKAADGGDSDAQHTLGVLANKNRDYESALRRFAEAAENGHHASQCFLGTMYFEGQGIEKDVKKAEDLWTKASKDKSSPRACCYLGQLYEEGGGEVESNAKKATVYYRLAHARAAGSDPAFVQVREAAEAGMHRLGVPPPASPKHAGIEPKGGADDIDAGSESAMHGDGDVGPSDDEWTGTSQAKHGTGKTKKKGKAKKKPQSKNATKPSQQAAEAEVTDAKDAEKAPLSEFLGGTVPAVLEEASVQTIKMEDGHPANHGDEEVCVGSDEGSKVTTVADASAFKEVDEIEEDPSSDETDQSGSTEPDEAAAFKPTIKEEFRESETGQRQGAGETDESVPIRDLLIGAAEHSNCEELDSDFEIALKLSADLNPGTIYDDDDGDDGGDKGKGDDTEWTSVAPSKKKPQNRDERKSPQQSANADVPAKAAEAKVQTPISTQAHEAVRAQSSSAVGLRSPLKREKETGASHVGARQARVGASNVASRFVQPLHVASPLPPRETKMRAESSRSVDPVAAPGTFCAICDVGYAKNNEKNHVRSKKHRKAVEVKAKSEGLSDLNCEVCAVICEDEEDMKLHVKSENHQKRAEYACILCGVFYEVGDNRSMKIHLALKSHVAAVRKKAKADTKTTRDGVPPGKAPRGAVVVAAAHAASPKLLEGALPASDETAASSSPRSKQPAWAATSTAVQPVARQSGGGGGRPAVLPPASSDVGTVGGGGSCGEQGGASASFALFLGSPLSGHGFGLHASGGGGGGGPAPLASMAASPGPLPGLMPSSLAQPAATASAVAPAASNVASGACAAAGAASAKKAVVRPKKDGSWPSLGAVSPASASSTAAPVAGAGAMLWAPAEGAQDVQWTPEPPGAGSGSGAGKEVGPLLEGPKLEKAAPPAAPAMEEGPPPGFSSLSPSPPPFGPPGLSQGPPGCLPGHQSPPTPPPLSGRVDVAPASGSFWSGSGKDPVDPAKGAAPPSAFAGMRTKAPAATSPAAAPAAATPAGPLGAAGRGKATVPPPAKSLTSASVAAAATTTTAWAPAACSQCFAINDIGETHAVEVLVISDDGETATVVFVADSDAEPREILVEFLSPSAAAAPPKAASPAKWAPAPAKPAPGAKPKSLVEIQAEEAQAGRGVRGARRPPPSTGPPPGILAPSPLPGASGAAAAKGVARGSSSSSGGGGGGGWASAAAAARKPPAVTAPAPSAPRTALAAAEGSAGRPFLAGKAPGRPTAAAARRGASPASPPTATASSLARAGSATVLGSARGDPSVVSAAGSAPWGGGGGDGVPAMPAQPSLVAIQAAEEDTAEDADGGWEAALGGHADAEAAEDSAEALAAAEAAAAAAEAHFRLVMEESGAAERKCLAEDEGAFTLVTKFCQRLEAQESYRGTYNPARDGDCLMRCAVEHDFGGQGGQSGKGGKGGGGGGRGRGRGRIGAAAVEPSVGAWTAVGTGGGGGGRGGKGGGKGGGGSNGPQPQPAVGAGGSGGAAVPPPPLSTADGLRLAVVWRARKNAFARVQAQIRQIESELGNARAKAQTAKDAVKSLQAPPVKVKIRGRGGSSGLVSSRAAASNIPGLSGEIAAKAAAAKDRAAAAKGSPGKAGASEFDKAAAAAKAAAAKVAELEKALHSLRAKATVEAVEARCLAMAKPGTVMGEDELQALADVREACVQVRSLICVQESSDYGATLKPKTYYPRPVTTVTTNDPARPPGRNLPPAPVALPPPPALPPCGFGRGDTLVLLQEMRAERMSHFQLLRLPTPSPPQEDHETAQAGHGGGKEHK